MATLMIRPLTRLGSMRFLSRGSGWALGLALMLALGSARGQTTDELRSLMKESDRIEAAEVLPLGLEGKTVSEAISELALRGYRCGILQNYFPQAHYALPVTCDRYAWPKYPACIWHSVDLSIDWSKDSGDRTILYSAMGSSRIARVASMCHPAIRLVERRLDASEASAIAASITRDQFTGRSLEDAWSILSAANFECGADEPLVGHEVVCSSRRRLTPTCHQFEFRFELDQEVSRDTFLHPRSPLVRNVRLSCWIAAEEARPA